MLTVLVSNIANPVEEPLDRDPGVLTLAAAGESADGYIPVRGPSQGAADTPLDLEDANASVRFQHSFGFFQISHDGTFFPCLLHRINTPSLPPRFTGE